MLRLADLLEKGLLSNRIDVAVIRPEPFFGLLARRWFVLHKWLRYVDKFVLFPFRLLAHARSSLLVHIIDHSNAAYCILLNPRRSIVTCNDLLAVRSARGEFPEHRTGVTGQLLQWLILKGLRRATQVASISEATRADLLRLTGRPGESVSCIYLGLAPIFESASEPESSSNEGYPMGEGPAARGIPKTYILHVGGDTWYKNRPGVLLIYSAIRNRLGPDCPDLFLVGPPIKTTIEGVHFFPAVTDAELAELYRKAALLLFPSFYEGFGWPVVEAQACGCRTVITRIPPLTEAGGTAAAWITNPRDVGAAADQVIRVLQEDPKTRKNRVLAGCEHSHGFSRDRMIARYLELYASILRQ
jgi:glycosyltransferase involved in cell wall biosynthesis